MSSVLKPIKGLVTLVTGGSSGLGKGTVEYLYQNGAKLAILDLPQSTGASLAQTLGDNAIFTPADVTSEEQLSEAVKAVKAKYGRLDAVVNCAGIAYAFKIYNIGKKEMSPLDKIKRTLDVNVIGTLNVIRHTAPLILENDVDDMGQRGVYVNTSSVAAYDGQVGQSAYSASKGAIAAVTLPLARDFAASGIRVVAIAPGLFDTPLLQNLPSKVRTFLSQLVPNPNRLGQPQEFGALVEHVLVNRYLNGEVIRVDGALRMPP